MFLSEQLCVSALSAPRIPAAQLQTRTVCIRGIALASIPPSQPLASCVPQESIPGPTLFSLRFEKKPLSTTFVLITL